MNIRKDYNFNPAMPTVVEYMKQVPYEQGKEIKFKDFTLLLVDSKTFSMGVLGGAERFRTEYYFVAIFFQDGVKKEKKFTWSDGYPGGLSGPIPVKINRRNNFSVDIFSGTVIAKKEKDGPEYGEKIPLVKDTILEYPDFDLTFVSASSEKHILNEKEAQNYKQAYIDAYKKNGTLLPTDLSIPTYYFVGSMDFTLSYASTSVKLTYRQIEGQFLIFDVRGQKYYIEPQNTYVGEQGNLTGDQKIIVDKMIIK